MSVPAIPPAAGWFPVQDVARFALTGNDRVRYLNGQVSNDVRKLAPGRAMQACVLSAKGRLDGVVWIWAEEDALIVEVQKSLEESMGVRLERYIVADDVELRAVATPNCVHVVGDAVARIPAGVRTREIRRLGVNGVDVEAPDAGTLCRSAGIEELRAETAERIRIENAVPAWGAELGPDTLPAEAGLDRAAVDFHKGCYIGQEVVSRIESVGHANRVLRVFEVIEGDVPSPGAEYFLPDAIGDRAAAIVTSVSFALSPVIGLCYIRRGTPEDQALESPGSASRIQLRPCVSPS